MTSTQKAELLKEKEKIGLLYNKNMDRLLAQNFGTMKFKKYQARENLLNREDCKIRRKLEGI